MINLFHRHNQKTWEIEKELKDLHKQKQKIKEKERVLLKKLEEVKE